MTTPVYALTPSQLEEWKQRHSAHAPWLSLNKFEAKAGSTLLVPGENGQTLACVLLGLGAESDMRSAGALAQVLPKGNYTLDVKDDLALLSFLLGSYSYTFGAECTAPSPQAHVEGCDREDIQNLARAIYLVRNMVNAPANSMNPQALQERVESVAHTHQAQVCTVVGEALVEAGFPLVHAVGKASSYAPRLIELNWGQEGPLITLVGKGVCFDTGGLDLKPPSGMALMKKDMGGAACALALALMMMQSNLPVRLKLLIPAVENSVSGNSYRPGDIITSRSGLSVEIGNTDAEGRLILADALSYAAESDPTYLIDFATLTGAARIALGPDLPAFFTPDNELASKIEAACTQVKDPIWRMPLWQPYQTWLKSSVADLNNIADNGYAGCIMAALFLQQFVPNTKQWMHFDLYAWRSYPSPFGPKGGEAYVIRGLLHYFQTQYPPS